MLRWVHVSIYRATECDIRKCLNLPLELCCHPTQPCCEASSVQQILAGLHAIIFPVIDSVFTSSRHWARLRIPLMMTIYVETLLTLYISFPAKHIYSSGWSPRWRCHRQRGACRLCGGLPQWRMEHRMPWHVTPLRWHCTQLSYSGITSAHWKQGIYI